MVHLGPCHSVLLGLAADCLHCQVSVNEASRAIAAQLHAFSHRPHTSITSLTLKLGPSALARQFHTLYWHALQYLLQKLCLFRIYSLSSCSPWTELTLNSGVTLQDTGLWPSSHVLQFLLRDDLKILISLSAGNMLFFFSCPFLLFVHTWEEYERLFTACSANW